MINKNILEMSLIKKFKNQTLNVIVTEAFIKALPVEFSELSKNDIRELTIYTKSVMESLGGYDELLEKNTNNDVYKNYLLDNIKDTCESIAVEAAKRIVSEENSTDNMGEIVDKAAFTKEEYTKFANNADNIGLEKISEIIKDKVINVIKAEKEAYEKEEELNGELEDAVKDTDVGGEGLEGYLDIILDIKDSRKHVSLFSKMQDLAFEALLYSKENFEEIPYKTLRYITLENSFDIFKNTNKDISTCLESINIIQDINEENVNTEKVMNASMLSSIVMYTLMESLNTLNIYIPSKKEIAEFMDKKYSSIDYVQENVNMIQNKVSNFINNIKIKTLTTTDTHTLNKNLDILTSCKEALISTENPKFDSCKEELCGQIDETCDAIKTKLDDKISVLKNPKELTKFEIRDKEELIAQLNKLATLFANNPMVKDIRLIIQTEKEPCAVMNVECKDHSGKTIDKSFVSVKHRPAFGGYIDFVKESYDNSNLSRTNKNVYVYYADTGKMVNL